MVGPHGLEVAMHVAELADVAWRAKEHHQEHVEKKKQEELEHAHAEQALEEARLENDKLRAALKEYEKALKKELELQGSAQTLGEESLHLSLNLYDQLKKRVESPEFLEKLREMPPDGDSSAVVKAESGVCVLPNSEDSNSWLLVDEDFLCLMKLEKDGLDSDGYVVVNQEDFVDGIATFLARQIASMPEAKSMSPEDLQNTMKKFQQYVKKARIRKVWEAGKMLYTASSWGATAFGLYKHRVVLQAGSMALWTTGTLILALLK